MTAADRETARAHGASIVRRIRWAGLLLVIVVVDAVYIPRVLRGEPTGLLAEGGAITDPRIALLIVNAFLILVLLLLLPGTGWLRRFR